MKMKNDNIKSSSRTVLQLFLVNTPVTNATIVGYGRRTMWKWSNSHGARTVAVSFFGHFLHIVRQIVAFNAELYSYDSP